MLKENFVKEPYYYEDIFDLNTIEEALKIQNPSQTFDNPIDSKFSPETILVMQKTEN